MVLLRAALLLVCLSWASAAGACLNPEVLGHDPPGRTLTAAQRTQVLAEIEALVRGRALAPSFRGRWPGALQRARLAVARATDDRGVYQALRALAEDLNDGHVAYLSPRDVAEETEASAFEASPARPGEVGLMATGEASGRLRVTAVRPGSPAARAGLLQGDQILRVNGACPAVEVGPVGSMLRLQVQSAGGPVRLVQLRRASPPPDPLIQTARLGPGADVGYLRFDTFDPDDIGGRLQAALYLLTQPGPLRGLIIDLRSNGGGQLFELRRFLGIFVQGEVGQYRDRAGTVLPLEPLRAYGEAVDRLRGVPITVLVSDYTQSAGEVAAAVLRRARGAWVQGQRTPGLTSVASIFPLPGGAEWHLPTADLVLGGVRLGRTGVVPDEAQPYAPPGAPERDPAVQRAVDRLRR